MPSIGVLEHFQNPSDKPLKFVKRSDGQTQVRRGMAAWVIKNVLLQLAPPRRATKEPLQRAEYIPFGLEPLIDAELGVMDMSPILPGQIRFRGMGKALPQVEEAAWL